MSVYRTIGPLVICDDFLLKNIDTLLLCVQNIDCGYMLELPLRGGSNRYPQFMFLIKNKKNGIPLHSSYSSISMEKKKK